MEAFTTGMVFETRSQCLDVYADFEKLKRGIEAIQAGILDAAHSFTVLTDSSAFAEQDLASELATLIHILEATAAGLISTAGTLVNELPDTHAALRAGMISYRHVEKLADHATSVPEDARHDFETAVLPVAEVMTVAKFDARARKLRERIHPESIKERRVSAFERRYVSVEKGRDGMSWITAHLPAEQCEAIDNRLEDIARNLRSDDDPRTLPQHRADAFADLLINGDPANRKSAGITASVNVTIPWLTLIGRSEEPGELEGYGPIPADVARELCAEATSFTRILTDPVTGTVLTLDRAKRLPPKKLAAWLRLRDGTCRFPGCNRKARKADIDHTIDWQHGGPTNADNLACLCEHHHRLKHNTRWTVEQIGDGILQWVSPDGRRHETRPELQLTG